MYWKKQITKNKEFGVSVHTDYKILQDRNSMLSVSLDLPYDRVEGGGFSFVFQMLKLIEINVYLADSRHWNDSENTWHTEESWELEKESWQEDIKKWKN